MTYDRDRAFAVKGTPECRSTHKYLLSSPGHKHKRLKKLNITGMNVHLGVVKFSV